MPFGINGFKNRVFVRQETVANKHDGAKKDAAETKKLAPTPVFSNWDLPDLPEHPVIEASENRSIGNDSRIHKAKTTEIRVNANSFDVRKSLEVQFQIERSMNSLQAYELNTGFGYEYEGQHYNEIVRTMSNNTDSLKEFNLYLFRPTKDLVNISGALRSLRELESLTIHLEMTDGHIKQSDKILNHLGNSIKHLSLLKNLDILISSSYASDNELCNFINGVSSLEKLDNVSINFEYSECLTGKGVERLKVGCEKIRATGSLCVKGSYATDVDGHKEFVVVDRH